MQFPFPNPLILFFLAFGCCTFSDALKCFTCEGVCDCRDNQVPETCAPDAFCFTVKATMSGQIIRKGCARDCRTVSNQNWQKCHLCDDENLCNDHEYRAGLFDDCAVEEFIGMGFGLPAKHRRPSAPNQQYRRSLHRYGESQGPTQNVGGGYAQSPSQTDGYASSGPQQNQLSAAQQQSAGPNQNSFLVNSPSVNAASSSSSEEEVVSSPGMTERGGGGGQPASARINAFLDRMSPRSVPVGFFGQQQNTDSQQQQQQQQWPQSRSPQFNNNQQHSSSSGGPRQNSFGGGGPQQNSGSPSLQFGGGLSPSQTQAGPDFGQGNGATIPPSLVNSLFTMVVALLALAALITF